MGPCNRNPEIRQKLCGVARLVVSCCGGLVVMAQEANSWDPGSIPGREHFLTSLSRPVTSLAPDSNWILVTAPTPLPPILNRLCLETNYELMIWSLNTFKFVGHQVDWTLGRNILVSMVTCKKISFQFSWSCFLWFSWLCSVFCGFLGCVVFSVVFLVELCSPQFSWLCSAVFWLCWLVVCVIFCQASRPQSDGQSSRVVDWLQHNQQTFVCWRPPSQVGQRSINQANFYESSMNPI